MTIAIIFWVLLLAAAGWILLQGSFPARLLLIAIFAAAIATGAAQTIVERSARAPWLFLIDAALLAAALVLTAKTDRYWPIWFSGFQLIATMCSLSRIVLPATIPALYADLGGFWAAPALMAMAFGVWFDRRFEVDG